MQSVTLSGGVVLEAMAPRHGAALADYFAGLWPGSKGQFVPHTPPEAVAQNRCGEAAHCAVLHCVLTHQDRVVGHFLLDTRPPAREVERYLSRLIRLQPGRDFMFAASVAHAWQGRGLASRAMPHLISAALDRAARSLVLAGGVPATNARALAFFRKWGFVPHGGFQGSSFHHDMRLVLDRDACAYD
jgi:GNAT superfamily N-acetyltransferase